MGKLNLTIDDGLLAAINMLAAAEDRSKAQMIAHLLKEGLRAKGYGEIVDDINRQQAGLGVDPRGPVPEEEPPSEPRPAHEVPSPDLGLAHDDAPPEPEEPRPWHEPVPRSEEEVA